MRAVIQYIMLDGNLVNTPQKDAAIYKTLQALESLAWLYNCNKLQLELTAVPTEYLNNKNYWIVIRQKSFYYNKNIESNL